MITQTLPLAFVLLMNKTPMELFRDGRGMMWPILIISLVMITVVVERIIFMIRENASREPEVVEKMLEHTESGDVEGALQIGKKSNDYLARILSYALAHKDSSLTNAFMRASSQELNRFQQGVATLDTIVTAAPLMGLLGTVTGMMATFGALGASSDISSSAGQITGGVAEALIATMCGLGIAIMGLFPLNILNARSEQAKHEVSDVSNALEIIIKKTENTPSR